MAPLSLFRLPILVWLGLSATCLAGDTMDVFTASWCKACVQFKTDLEANPELLRSYPVNLVDYDTNKDLVKSLGITKIPTFILMRKDKEIARKAGYKDLADLKAWLDKHQE